MRDIRRVPSFVRLRGRSFMALVLAPEPPLAYVVDRARRADRALPVVLRQPPGGARPRRPAARATGYRRPDEALDSRGIRIIGTEGAHPSWKGVGNLGPPVAQRRPRDARRRRRPMNCRHAARRTGRRRAAREALLIDHAGAFRPVGRVPERRRDRARLGRLGRRGRRRRLDPRLRHAARPRDGRDSPATRGRASSAASSKPNCWRSTASTRPRTTWTRNLRGRAGPGLARRRDLMSWQRSD